VAAWGWKFGARGHAGLAAVAAVLASVTFIAGAAAQDEDSGDIAGSLQDAIVGTWSGQASQPDTDPFEVRLTFVSPHGGVSRYPGSPPCGGMLVGDRRGDNYEYQESITYGGTDEKTDGCLNGNMKLTVNGETMKYEWSANYNGQDYSSSGELKRTGGGARKKR
jgi:hypothetical protein